MNLPTVDNDLYRRMGHSWWDDEAGEFSTIRFFVNPARSAYFLRVLGEGSAMADAPRTLLDVGCGGGILAEEFARANFLVSGIDPAPETIDTARSHAERSGLAIDYRVGSGESLPFQDASFDIAACCDVLEHVEDAERVIHEIARVLKPGGIFLYDTINRTPKSRMAIIKSMQEWKATAFAAPNTHVWEKFITPLELREIFGRQGLIHGEMRGILPRRNPLRSMIDLYLRAKGKITFKELGQRLDFRESDDLSVSYMGFAKRGPGH